MPVFEEYPDIIEINELCALLNICKNTAYGLLRTGEISGIKCGSIWKIPLQSVMEYVGYRRIVAKERFRI